MKKRFIIAGAVAALWLGYCFIPVWVHQPLQIGQIKIVDRHDRLIAHLPKRDGLMIPFQADDLLPEKFTHALIQVEDQRYYQHWGIDVIAKFRALLSNVSAGEVVSGGSTLTEQWVKNNYFRGYRRTLPQKLREVTLAFYFSSSLSYSKDSILRDYLNQAYFGERIYGLRAAAWNYFGKSDLNTLNDEEIVTLITMLRSPLARSTNEIYFQSAYARVADLLNLKVSLNKKSFEPFDSINLFPHVTASILQEVKNKKEPDLFIESTIDSKLQTEVQDQLQRSISLLYEHNVQNGAVYVMQPNTGEILAWQGSKDFYDDAIDGQVNVIQKKRQMGSALKPFVYLYAFLKGAHPDHLIVDLEKDFYQSDEEGFFRPLNYSLTEGGVIPLKEALAGSFNVSAVRLLDHLGLQPTYEFMQTLGLHFDYAYDHYGLSLALGSPDLTMQNVADTYSLLANGGKKIDSHLIRSIDSVQQPVYSEAIFKNSPAFNTALFQLFQVLSSQTNRRLSFGLDSILNTSIPFAVKTGTTRNFKDNWTFGYHPSLVVAVWVGNNDSSSMVDVTGVTGAAPIWHRVVEAAIDLGYVSADLIDRPDGLNEYEKCLDADCYQKETYYYHEPIDFLSNLSTGHFCLEDFYIQDIDPAEVSKIAKLFHFKDFTIQWCERGAESVALNSEPIILKPVNGQRFYIKKSIPLELQRIIVKASQPVDWKINDQIYSDEAFIFIEPTQENYDVEIVDTGQKISFAVEYVDE